MTGDWPVDGMPIGWLRPHHWIGLIASHIQGITFGTVILALILLTLPLAGRHRLYAIAAIGIGAVPLMCMAAYVAVNVIFTSYCVMRSSF
jgi:hypothetical protein